MRSPKKTRIKKSHPKRQVVKTLVKQKLEKKMRVKRVNKVYHEYFII